MNNWPNLDNLQFEKLGMSRNALFLTVAVAFALYLLVDFLSKPYLEHAAGLIQLAPLIGTAAFWWFVMIPQVRKWNETLPKGHFQGLADYYLFNPRNLEITNDPEPMPLYVKQAAHPPHRPTQRGAKLKK
ncbi:hypothetical protein [Deinococcus aluminii]|uniref:PrgI family protein n=1 Tax=Deinococcus aluminii TaxID=1656885 RepID=A0ABP9XH02_9DEIO